MDSGFKFELDQKVALSLSGESGIVVGRAEYLRHERQYFVRYKTANGEQVERWHDESAIVSKRSPAEAKAGIPD